jgi:hypothetical protein
VLRCKTLDRMHRPFVLVRNAVQSTRQAARGRPRLATAVILVVAVSVGLGLGFLAGRITASDDSGSKSGTPCPPVQATTRTPAPVAQFAPLVFLHPSERRRPLPVDCFLANARLRWTRTVLTDVGELDPSKLGTGGYTHHVSRQSCKSNGCTYTTADLTRPYEPRRSHLRSNAGFFLDISDRYRAGATSTESDSPIFAGTPTYYEFVHGHYVTYWFFYGHSAPAALAASGGISAAAHEGDWEHISVHLDPEDQPFEIAYFAHGKAPLSLLWREAPRLGTHPVVFSAQGSHASYPRAAVYRSNFDVTRVGLLWPTWDLLVDARLQPWYGYGGAWGVPASQAVPDKWASEFTGPLGPSKYKAPAPCEWRPNC